MWNHQEGSKNIPCCEKVFSTRYFSIKWHLSSRWPSTWRWESWVHVGSCYWDVSSRDGRYSEHLDWSCSGLWSRTVAAVPLAQIKGDRIPRSWAPLHVGPGPCCSVAKWCPNSATPPARQASLSFPISLSLLKLMSVELMMLSNHLILCHLLLFLPLIFPSIRVFSSELALHIRWRNYWSFSFSLSNESSGLISFRIDWFDLLAVQGTLKSLLQHHSSKASILRRSAFFMIQLSYGTWPLEKPELWLEGSLSAKWCLCFLIRWLAEPGITFF